MDMSQQYCLRWNNYPITMHHIFHKLWMTGTFVDVTLVVEDRRINCHKVILSACSTYFEQLLVEYDHPNPIILLLDVPFSAVQSLVHFMYNGEIDVSQFELVALLQVAESLKIKGIAGSIALSNFAKYRLLSPEITNVSTTYPYQSVPVPSPPSPTPSYTSPADKRVYSAPFQNESKKRPRPFTQCLKPLKKKHRHDESTASLPPSPPISLGEPQNNEHARTSPPVNHLPEVKVEPEEETDTELQIDESVDQSPSEATDSDTFSNRNTPVPEMDPQELVERHETAKSLAALASQGTMNLLNQHTPPQQLQKHLLAPKRGGARVKEERTSGNGKNGERSYTLQDLEEGIELVITQKLTPAKAIAKYKVPRRTFFRRLSAVRKSRGIPSSKENASEHFLNNKASALRPQSTDGKQIPLVIPGIASNESMFLQNISKVAKLNTDVPKKGKKPQGLNLASGNVFNLLSVAASPNYEYYLKYFRLQQANQIKDILGVPDVKKERVIDGNRNLAPEVPEQALALVTQNGSLK